MFLTAVLTASLASAADDFTPCGGDATTCAESAAIAADELSAMYGLDAEPLFDALIGSQLSDTEEGEVIGYSDARFTFERIEIREEFEGTEGGLEICQVTVKVSTTIESDGGETEKTEEEEELERDCTTSNFPELPGS